MPAAGGRAAQNGKGNREKMNREMEQRKPEKKPEKKTAGKTGAGQQKDFRRQQAQVQAQPTSIQAQPTSVQVQQASIQAQQAPVRVLQVLGGTSLGGAESRVMDSYRHLDRSRIQFDFCVHTQEEGFFDKEIESLGGHIYRVPRFRAVKLAGIPEGVEGLFPDALDRGASGLCGGTWTYDEHRLHLPAHCKSRRRTPHHRPRQSAGVDPGLKGMLTRFCAGIWGKRRTSA